MEIRALLRSWERHLVATNKAPGTVGKYVQIARQFCGWLEAEGEPTGCGEIRRRHIEGYVAHVLEGRKASTAATHHQALRQLFAWLLDEDEIAASPFVKTRPPFVPEAPVPVLGAGEGKRLLLVVSGPHRAARRDAAILRLFPDTGIPCSELVNLRVDDVDLQFGHVQVLGKGRRVRVVPFGNRTA